MPGAIVIRPMTHEAILWRCLHSGPLGRDSLDRLPEERRDDWEHHRRRNMPLLERLMALYGSCAMLAWDGDLIVGFLRFYPKAISSLKEAGGLCLQQAFPAGPSDQLADAPLPSPDEMVDKVLVVHCLMTGSPFQKENPYQRRGIGTRLAQELISWAQSQGWQAIETNAYHDIDTLYSNTGQAGRHFWERLGFRLVATHTQHPFQGEFLATMRRQARERGVDPDRITDRFTMRLDLTSAGGDEETCLGR